MNRQITRLFVLFVLLYALLVAFTSRWSIFEAESLEQETGNRRELIEAQQIRRGRILARDGTVIARSRRLGRGETRRYVREYPQGPLFSHAVGYAYVQYDAAGVELEYNDELIGESNEFESILDELSNAPDEGNDLHTTLDTGAQRVARGALGGRPGSVVAIEPDSGAVRVLVGVPDFDPNRIPDGYPQLSRQRGSPLLNRATQSGYPPGSTMKVVTATAALDTGRFEPSSIVDGSSPKTISGVTLANFGGTDYGPITLTDALTNSVNTAWAGVGVRMGTDTMFRYMDRFGFNSEPEIDLPNRSLFPSGVYDGGDLVDDPDEPLDLGRVSIGQGPLLVTPIQMAQVAAAVANGGRLMKPRLVDRVVDPDGRTRDRVNPSRQSRVMSSGSARKLAEMMSKVVEEGSGTAAALEGISVGGKTGTAEVEGGNDNQGWFIAFAPVDDPKIAVAVTIERIGGTATGGETAAPIARQVMQELIGG